MAEIQTIGAGRYDVDSGGYPYIELAINGRSTRLYYDQKLLRFGAVFLGEGFDEFAFIIPADTADSRPRPEQVTGFTNDVRIVQMVVKLREDVDSGRFRPGSVA